MPENTAGTPPLPPPAPPSKPSKGGPDPGPADALTADTLAAAIVKAGLQAAQAGSLPATPRPDMDRSIRHGKFGRGDGFVNCFGQDIDEDGNLLDINQPRQGDIE